MIKLVDENDDELALIITASMMEAGMTNDQEVRELPEAIRKLKEDRPQLKNLKMLDAIHAVVVEHSGNRPLADKIIEHLRWKKSACRELSAALTSSTSQAATGARENEKPCPWVRTAERRPTKSDADCEGQIWTWQEYFSENEETAQMESIGFRVRRHGWMGVARYDRFAAPFWMPTGFTRPKPPVPEVQQSK